MSEEFWYKDKKKLTCPFCNWEGDMGVDVFRPAKTISTRMDGIEVLTYFKRRSSTVCPSCGRSWDHFKEWETVEHPKKNNSVLFLKKRSDYLKTLGKPFKAIQGLTDYLSVSPGDSVSWMELAYYQRVDTKFKDAFESINKALEINTNFSEALELKASMAFDYILAQEDLNTDKIHLRDEFVRSFISYSHMKNELMEDYRKLLTIHKDNAIKMAEIYIAIARLAEEMYYFKEGIDYCRYSLSVLTDPAGKSRAHIQMGRIYEHLGKYNEAVECFDAGEKSYKNSLVPIYKARIFQKMGIRYQSEMLFTMVLNNLAGIPDSDPKAYKKYLLMAYVLTQQGNIEEAVKSYKAIGQLENMEVDSNNVGMNVVIRAYANRKAENLTKRPMQSSLEVACPRCKQIGKMNVYHHDERSCGLDNSSGGLANIVYYRQDRLIRCVYCNYGWIKIITREEIESEHP